MDNNFRWVLEWTWLKASRPVVGLGRRTPCRAGNAMKGRRVPLHGIVGTSGVCGPVPTLGDVVVLRHGAAM